jgi:hypothetical protein
VRTFFLSLFLIPFTASAGDELAPWKAGLPGGDPVAHSTSPNGKWELFEINRYDMGRPTTDRAVAVMDTHGTTLVGLLDCENHIAVDFPDHAYLTIKWSPDSSYLAIHDSTPKNSVLEIYQITASELQKLSVPDLRHLAAAQLQIPEKKITGSGQLPVEWSKSGDLTVRVRLSVDGDTIQKDFAIHVSPTGVAQVSH